MIDDTTYTPIATVHAANGLQADLHEFQLTPQDTALITAYTPVYWTVGKKRRIVLDSVVQEIDIRDRAGPVPVGRLDHVPLSSSYEGVPRSRYHPYDYFHVNSIQQDTDGNLIVSSRDTFAAYKINRNTGQVMWILGGKRSSFRMGRGRPVRVPARRRVSTATRTTRSRCSTTAAGRRECIGGPAA